MIFVDRKSRTVTVVAGVPLFLLPVALVGVVGACGAAAVQLKGVESVLAVVSSLVFVAICVGVLLAASGRLSRSGEVLRWTSASGRRHEFDARVSAFGVGWNTGHRGGVNHFVFVTDGAEKVTVCDMLGSHAKGRRLTARLSAALLDPRRRARRRRSRSSVRMRPPRWRSGRRPRGSGGASRGGWS